MAPERAKNKSSLIILIATQKEFNLIMVTRKDQDLESQTRPKSIDAQLPLMVTFRQPKMAADRAKIQLDFITKTCIFQIQICTMDQHMTCIH